jgi:hypothetical protein
MARDLEGTRVVKTMPPSQAGALKLARRYGDALVCVRYRHDAEGLNRYTTVELVVDRAPVQARAAADAVVGVKLDYNEKALHSMVRARGARWDAGAKLWRMPLSVAKQLSLLARVVQERP